MKLNCTLLLIVIIATIAIYGAAADSGGAVHTENQVLSKNNGSDAGVGKAVDPVKKGTDSNLNISNPSHQLVSNNGGVNEKETGSVKDEQKENKVSDSKSKENTGQEAPVRGKCDSSSNNCTDDDNTLVACLRVPGDESPDLSLLIQNKGKGPLTVTISAPDLVQLEKKQIELQQKEDTEVKVSIKGVENGHVIILSAGHGNCSLDFKDQFVARKQVDITSKSTHLSFSNQSSSNRLLFLAALLIVAVLVLIFLKLWKKFSRKATTKYQMLDMELPISSSGKVEASVNESWDDSWGDSWDDEEAPKTPSLPVTPSLSSKGMASRKFNKENWKD